MESTRNEILDAIRCIDDTVEDGKITVESAMFESCCKALAIMENYDGEDLSSFSIFQEGFFAEANNNNTNRQNSGNGQPAKKGGVMNVINTLITFLTQMFGRMVDTIKRAFSGEISPENIKAKNDRTKAILKSANEDKKNRTNTIVRSISNISEDTDTDKIKKTLIGAGIGGASIASMILIFKRIIQNKHKLKDRMLELYKKAEIIPAKSANMKDMGLDKLIDACLINADGTATIPLDLSVIMKFIAAVNTELERFNNELDNVIASGVNKTVKCNDIVVPVEDILKVTTLSLDEYDEKIGKCIVGCNMCSNFASEIIEKMKQIKQSQQEETVDGQNGSQTDTANNTMTNTNSVIDTETSKAISKISGNMSELSTILSIVTSTMSSIEDVINESNNATVESNVQSAPAEQSADVESSDTLDETQNLNNTTTTTTDTVNAAEEVTVPNQEVPGTESAETKVGEDESVLNDNTPWFWR